MDDWSLQSHAGQAKLIKRWTVIKMVAPKDDTEHNAALAITPTKTLIVFWQIEPLFYKDKHQ